MKFPAKIQDMKICDCGMGDWEIISIEVDDKIRERFRTLLSCKDQKRILNYLKKRGKGEVVPKKQYILKMRCGFTWNKFVSEKMLKELKRK